MSKSQQVFVDQGARPEHNMTLTGVHEAEVGESMNVRFWKSCKRKEVIGAREGVHTHTT